MISYAGIELLLDNPSGEVQAWLDQILPLDDLRLISDWSIARINLSGGLPLPNYSQPLRPQLNTWYRPTGASRWSFGLFLATTAQKDQIMSAVGSSNSRQQLAIGVNGIDRGWTAYLLPPRPISAEINDASSLWILPLVDERYYWQFIAAPLVEIDDAGSWTTLFTLLKGTLGMSALDVDTISSSYGTPNSLRLQAASYKSAAVMLDALAHSVGQRVYLKYQPTGSPRQYYNQWYQSGNPTTWQSRLNVNLSTAHSGALQSGTVSGAGLNLAAILPASVQVVFRKWASGIVWNNEFYTKSISASTAGVTSGTTAAYIKTINTTALANYTSGSIDNQSACDALALQIATDFYASLLWVQDSVYIGVSDWQETGFDDYIEFTLARVLPGGGYTSQTRVHTVPYNFGVEEQVQQLTGTHEYGDIVEGVLDGDLAALGTATLSVYEGSPLADTGRNVTVTDPFGITLSAGSAAMAFRVGKYWQIDGTLNNSTAPSNTVQIGKTDAAIAKSASGTVSIYSGSSPGSLSDTTVNVTAYARFQRIESGKWVAVIRKSWGYEVIEVEPNLMIYGKPTALTQFGNSATITIYAGTKGSESTTETTVSAYVRTGLVLLDQPVICGWVDQGYEVLNPALEFVGKSSALKQTGETATMTIYKGTKGSETSASATASAYVREGFVLSAPLYRVTFIDAGWEIADPTIGCLAVAAADIAMGASGNCTLNSTTISVHATFGDIPNTSNVWVSWDAANSRLCGIQIPCPA